MSKTCSCYFSSSTGKKFVMAVTGLGLIGFVIAHLLGNLQVFIGQDQFNSYAYFLQHLGELLWVARISLLGMVVLHIWAAVKLTLENRAARPVAYVQKDYVAASYASRTMAVSGTIVFSFIVYHLMHFTLGIVHPQYYHLTDAQGRHDVYSMLVLSFQNPLISLAYIVSIFLLCMHLSHGIGSFFQSLGLNNEPLRSFLNCWAPKIAWLIFLGYASIPAGVLLHIVTLPPGVHP